MNFDELLDFLFHKWIGVCISICATVIMVLGLSSCLPLDLCACWCGAWACDDAAYCFESSSEECDDICFDCFGGAYDGDSYRKDSSCALNECLFGRYGCQSECGESYIDCGGLNTSFWVAICENVGCDYGDCSCGGTFSNCNTEDGAGCYTSDYGTKRFSCANCLVYCDGPDDPDSPNYSPDYLYSIKVVDYYGNVNTVAIYSNTTYIPAEEVKGMRFIGYYSQPDGQGTHFSNGVLPSANTTVYSYYIDAYKNIKFTFQIYTRLQNGLNSSSYIEGELFQSFEIYSGDSIASNLNTLPEIEGYYLNQWQYAKDSYYNGNATLTPIGDSFGLFSQYETLNPAEFDIPTNSETNSVTIKLFMDYKLVSHMVTIEHPTEIGTGTKLFEVLHKTTVQSIKDQVSATHQNKIFAGFSLSSDGDVILDDNYEITEDTTLYAKYKAPIIINFKDNEDVDTTYSYTYYDGQIVELPAPKNVPVGKQFAYWTLSSDFSKKYQTITVTDRLDGVTLIAVYTAVKYTITFYDGEAAVNTLNYYMGDTTAFNNLEKDYYTFDGWYKTSDFKGTKVTSISATDAQDYSLYAKFIPKKYVIELNAMGGTVSNYDVQVPYGENFTLPIPTRKGYTFEGWYFTTGLSERQLTDEKGKSISEFAKYNGYDYPDSNNIGIMAYAKWIANVYTITFKGEGIETTTITCNHGFSITSPQEPMKPGYTFAGWYNGNTLYDFSSKVYSDLTITAKFEPITYTIKLVIKNGSFKNSGLSELTVTYVYGSGVIKINDVPVRDGYAFTGWYLYQNGTGSVYVRENGSVTSYLDSYVTTPGVSTYVLYAGWIADNN